MLNATVVERIEVTPELLILRLKPDAGVPNFEPGQYVAVGLPGESPRLAGLPAEKEPSAPGKIIKRAYSIGSSPEIKDYIELYVAIVPEGQLTPRLFVPKVNDRVFVAPKITGTFTLHGIAPDHNLVLISTGTGIAPYLSMIRTPATWTLGRKITIIHGVRYSKDLGYRDELLSWEEKKPGLFRYIPIVSREEPSWTGHKGRIQTLFTGGVVPLNSELDHVFLCGNPAMIEEAEVLLAGKGYTVHGKKNPTGKLHLEKYW